MPYKLPGKYHPSPFDANISLGGIRHSMLKKSEGLPTPVKTQNE
jgi:hypothetical protein